MLRVLVLMLMACSVALAGSGDYKIAGQAGKAYEDGNFTTARSLANAILTSPDVNIQIYALLMTGVTSTQPEAGLEQIQTCLTRIANTKITSNEQREFLNNTKRKALIAEVNLLIQTKDLATAASKLEAFTKGYPGAEPGAVDLAKSKIAFFEDEYDAALTLANRAHNTFSTTDQRRASQVLIKIGLYQMLTGKVEEGFKTTLRAQSGLVKGGDSDQYYFSLINMLIYHKSRGQDGGSLVKTITNRLRQEPDRDLEMLLDFAENWVP